jgi:hypothetical protein
MRHCQHAALPCRQSAYDHHQQAPRLLACGMVQQLRARDVGHADATRRVSVGRAHGKPGLADPTRPSDGDSTTASLRSLLTADGGCAPTRKAPLALGDIAG